MFGMQTRGRAFCTRGVYTAPVPNPDHETVQRPPPGLARGVWEARPWLFYAIAAAVVVAAIAYALRRTGAVTAWRLRAARRASRLR